MLDRRTLLIYGLRAALAGTCAPVLAKVALGARPWPIYCGYDVNPDIAALLEAAMKRAEAKIVADFSQKVYADGTSDRDDFGLASLLSAEELAEARAEPEGRWEWVEYAQSVTISGSS